MKHVIYLGNDGEFVESLKQFKEYNEFDEVEIILDTYASGKIIDLSITLLPYIIFVDFTDPLAAENSLFQEIILLKKHERLKGILFVALWGDEDDKSKYHQVFTSGFQLAFIKGCEREILFFDSFMIGFGKRLRLPQYAQARNIDLPLKVGFCSTLTSISADDFIIETDIDFMEEKLSVDLKFIQNVSDTLFTVQQHKAINYCYSMLMTYLMKYPYPGPWDEVTDQSWQKDTIETWINLNQENLLNHKTWFKIFSPYIELMKTVYDLSLKFDINFDFVEKSSAIRDELVLKLPLMIFYDVYTSPEHEINLDEVIEVISAIKTIDDYKPVLIITNCQTKTAALKKIYGYQNIMAIEERLSEKMLMLFTQSFMGKDKIDHNGPHYYFKSSDPMRALNIYQDIFLISLTEHEVTFFSPVEIPMYSILHFHLPLDFYGTIIPTDSEMKKHTKGWLYTVIIHGISEEGLENLRQFINQIIFTPLEALTKETVRAILARNEENKKPLDAVDAQTKNQVDVAVENNETKRPDPVIMDRRRIFKGKSKL